MRALFFLLFICSTLTSGCHKKVAETTAANESPTGPVKTVVFGNTELLKIGETCKPEKSNATFTFLDLVSDNRCPKGVNCIQAGEAVVMVQVGGKGPQRVMVDTDPKTISRVNIEGGTVEILDLNPYPEGGSRIEPAQRVLTIRLVQGEKMR